MAVARSPEPASAVDGLRSGPQNTVPPNAQAIQPAIVSTDLAVGPNRFVFGLVDQGTKALVMDAQLHLRLFKLADHGAVESLKGEADAQALTLEKNYTHVHQDGTQETHGAGIMGVYVAYLEFDSPGEWGVEITGTADGQALPTLTRAFDVRGHSFSPALGEPAPRSVQMTLKDVGDLFEIDTSIPPDPHMHDMTISDAVTSGKPSVIAFSTPGFCVTQLCGPTKDLVDRLYESHQGEANFIHVEPYNLKKARNGQGLEVLPFITGEWGLQTEPWVFLVDKKGNVAAKFEGVMGFLELEEALAKASQ
ncbi:MAG: peroxiredoxin family protein [Dehalococcoidia bacterium]